MESDVGGQRRAAIQSTVQFLTWTWGKNPNETEENKTVPTGKEEAEGLYVKKINTFGYDNIFWT